LKGLYPSKKIPFALTLIWSRSLCLSTFWRFPLSRTRSAYGTERGFRFDREKSSPLHFYLRRFMSPFFFFSGTFSSSSPPSSALPIFPFSTSLCDAWPMLYAERRWPSPYTSTKSARTLFSLFLSSRVRELVLVLAVEIPSFAPPRTTNRRDRSFHLRVRGSFWSPSAGFRIFIGALHRLSSLERSDRMSFFARVHVHSRLAFFCFLLISFASFLFSVARR